MLIKKTGRLEEETRSSEGRVRETRSSEGRVREITSCLEKFTYIEGRGCVVGGGVGGVVINGKARRLWPLCLWYTMVQSFCWTQQSDLL
jgi:hypothetical protein